VIFEKIAIFSPKIWAKSPKSVIIKMISRSAGGDSNRKSAERAHYLRAVRSGSSTDADVFASGSGSSNNGGNSGSRKGREHFR
jgi:hypothetical protein